MLPVVGLVFAGLSSTTLAVLSQVSRISAIAVVVALLLAIAWLGWRRKSRSAPGKPGALRALGVWGPCRGPHVNSPDLEGEALLEHDRPALDHVDRGIREGDVRDLGRPIRVRTSGLLGRRL